MKHLRFEKTNIKDTYSIYNRKDEFLGQIFYLTPWKCWVYEPDEVYMSVDCLIEVTQKLLELGNKSPLIVHSGGNIGPDVPHLNFICVCGTDYDIFKGTTTLTCGCGAITKFNWG